MSALLSVEACANLLRVSARTVRNWEAGTARIPFASYKLLRLLRGGKVLGPEWREFYIRRDALVTPEGHEFRAGDLAWWSLTVRMAHEFRAIMQERRGQHREAVEVGTLDARARPAETLARTGDKAAAAALTPSASEPSATQRPPIATATKDRPRSLPRANRGAAPPAPPSAARGAQGAQDMGENGAVAPSAADRVPSSGLRRSPRPARENPLLGLPSSNRGVSETERNAGESVPTPQKPHGAAALPQAGAAAPASRLGRVAEAAGGAA